MMPETANESEDNMRAKRWISGVLAAAMLLAMPVQALAVSAAEENSIRYTQGEYTFEKLTHADKEVGTTDGIVDYIGGGSAEVVTDAASEYYNAGDRGQSYSWSALSYGDWVYVGTCYSAMSGSLSVMGKTNVSDRVMHSVYDALFNGDFFYQEPDGAAGKGVLVKINTKTGETVVLMSQAENGLTPSFRNAVEYNGKLYFCGTVGGSAVGSFPSVWQIDPETDEFKVVYQGITNMMDYAVAYKQGVSTGIRGMCVYKDQLVISNVSADAATGTSTTTLLISSDPEQGFTKIADSADLFNYPAYRYADALLGGGIWDIAEYNGKLYVIICTGTKDNMPDDNTMQGFAIVRGEQNEDGTFTWSVLAGDQEKDGARYPFSIDPESRAVGASLVVYDGYLYIGDFNDQITALSQILFSSGDEFSFDLDFMNANLSNPVSLYRMDENEDVELVVGNKTKMFPNGSLSGLGSGFGHSENQYIWRMQVYDGKLYVGTFDTSSMLQPVGQFANGDLLFQPYRRWKSQFDYIKQLAQTISETNEEAAGNTNKLAALIKSTYGFAVNNLSVSQIASMLKMMNYMRKAERGFDLYVTEDGVNFETITTDGFGDPYNYGLRVFAVTDQGLCIGTGNPFYGTQVWVQRAE